MFIIKMYIKFGVIRIFVFKRQKKQKTSKKYNTTHKTSFATILHAVINMGLEQLAL